MDPLTQELQQYNWRVGRIYPSPAYILEAPKGERGTDLHTPTVPMRTCQQVAYSAPTYQWKSNDPYPVRKVQQQNLGVQNASSPQTGIYTGIPSGCSNGMGGNPYS